MNINLYEGLAFGFLGFIIIILLLWSLRSRAKIKRFEKALASSSDQLEALQHAFHRFAPQVVVEEIISLGIATQGEKKEVTVLFADIIGFTTLSETMSPEALVKILNGYFFKMTQVIANHRGYVSKFIGDGLLALFGALEPNPWQAMDAVKASLAMLEALEEYNNDLKQQKMPVLDIGIGIHSGLVIAGVIRSSHLMEYTVMGDVVNTASRIEGLTRKAEVPILISSAVEKQLDSRFLLRRLRPVKVRGKSKKIATYALEGFKSEVDSFRL